MPQRTVRAQVTRPIVKFSSYTSIGASPSHDKELTVNQRGRNPRTEGSAAKTIQVKARATLCLTCTDEPQSVRYGNNASEAEV